jgi:hypothetical protein
MKERMDNMAYVWTEIEGEYTSCHFETEEEAIAEARSEAEEGFWVGEVKEIDIDFVKDYRFGQEIVERFGDYVTNEIGVPAQEYLMFVDDDVTEKLDTEIVKVVKKWLKNNNLEPNFYDVVNEKFYPKL